MKKFLIGIVVLALAAVVVCCRHEEKFSIVPHIEFVSLEKVDDGDIFYVRRISAKHRLVYQINEDTQEILIWEMWNHYDRIGQKRRKK